MKIDQDSGHAYVIEELDEQTLVVKEVMLGELKGRLDEVSRVFLFWMWKGMVLFGGKGLEGVDMVLVLMCVCLICRSFRIRRLCLSRMMTEICIEVLDDGWHWEDWVGWSGSGVGRWCISDGSLDAT